MPHDHENSTIVLRLPRSKKGRYVAASRAAGQTLAAWILARLDAASDPSHPEKAPAPQPGQPGANPGRRA